METTYEQTLYREPTAKFRTPPGQPQRKGKEMLDITYAQLRDYSTLNAPVIEQSPRLSQIQYQVWRVDVIGGSPISFSASRPNAADETSTTLTQKMILDISLWLKNQEISHWDNFENLPPSLETSFASSKRYEASGLKEVALFCKENGLEKAIDCYINTARRVFDNAPVALSLVADPESGSEIKIQVEIKVEGDVASIMELDYDFFQALEVAIPDPRIRIFFVKTYDIAE